jgi:hypothetical protein
MTTRHTPIDSEADAIYQRLCNEAAAAGLLAMAYAGVAILSTPAAQRSNGERATILRASELTEHPDNPQPRQDAEQGDLFHA